MLKLSRNVVICKLGTQQRARIVHVGTIEGNFRGYVQDKGSSD